MEENKVVFTAEIYINSYTQKIIKDGCKDKGKSAAVKWLKENGYANVSLSSLISIVESIVG